MGARTVAWALAQTHVWIPVREPVRTLARARAETDVAAGAALPVGQLAVASVEPSATGVARLIVRIVVLTVAPLRVQAIVRVSAKQVVWQLAKDIAPQLAEIQVIEVIMRNELNLAKLCLAISNGNPKPSDMDFVASNSDFIGIVNVIFHTAMARYHAAYSDEGRNEARKAYRSNCEALVARYTPDWYSPELCDAIFRVGVLQAFDSDAAKQALLTLADEIQKCQYNALRCYIGTRISNIIVRMRLYLTEPYTSLLSEMVELLESCDASDPDIQLIDFME